MSAKDTKSEVKASNSSTPERYLVTGGTGFLGGHLVQQLLSSGALPRLLVRTDPGKAKLKGVEYVVCSLTDEKAVRAAAEGCKGIFHLAGLVVHSRQPEHAAPLQETNVESTLSLLRAIKGLPQMRFIFASTSGVVACSPTNQGVIEDDAPYSKTAIQWPYYRSKIEAEQLARSLPQENGVTLVCMRPAVMLGPGDDMFRSTHFIASYLQRKIPVIPTGGYAYLDVRDAASAFIAAMRHPRPAPSYLLCSDSPSTADMFKKLEAVSGVKGPAIKLPAQATLQVATLLDRYNRHIKGTWDAAVDPVRAEMGACFWGASSKLAERDLNFKPRPSKETLSDTIAYLREHHPALRGGAPPRAKL